LDFDLLLAVADKLSIVSFDPHEPVFGINEEAYHMYFIITGQVEIRNMENHLLAVLEEEDFFGDESIFSEKPREYSATCVGESILLSLSRTNLLTIISEYPSVALGFLQAYTSMTPFRIRSK
jgi:CRP/FNR family transcriptional regulator, cyclic AMP receptor protein